MNDSILITVQLQYCFLNTSNNRDAQLFFGAKERRMTKEQQISKSVLNRHKPGEYVEGAWRLCHDANPENG